MEEWLYQGRTEIGVYYGMDGMSRYFLPLRKSAQSSERPTVSKHGLPKPRHRCLPCGH